MRLARQFAWISAGRLIAAAVQAATLIVAARSTSLTTFAILTAALGLSPFLQTVADAGLSQLAIRSSAAGDDTRRTRGALRAIDLTSAGLSLVGGIGASLVALHTSAADFWLVAIAAAMGLEKNAEARMGVALALGAAATNARVLIARRSVALLLTIVLVSTGWEGASSYAVGYLVSCALAAVVAQIDSARRVGRSRSSSDRLSFGVSVKLGLPYWANSLAVQVRNIDAFVATALANPVNAAAYGITSRLAAPLRLLPTSLAAVLMPSVARPGGTTVSRAVRISWLTSAASTVFFGAGALFVPWALPTALGPQHGAAVVPLQIALLGLPFATATSLLSATMQGAGYARSVAVAAAVSSGACIALVAAGSAMNSASAAALGLATSFVIHLVVLIALARRDGLFGLP